MSERIVNTHYNLCRTVHVHARSAPSSPEAVAKGNDTPVEPTWLYSEIVKRGLVPSRKTSPSLSTVSSDYPGDQRLSEAVIAKQLQEVVVDRDTSTVKGLPGSALTSVYSTLHVPEEGRGSDDDRIEWTTVTRKSRHGSPAKDSH